MTEEEYNQRSLANTQAKLQNELAEVARQRSKLKSNDKRALEGLAAQEADIRTRQIRALEEYGERQVQVLEKAQRKANDAISLTETERLTEIQELRNQDLITQTEADLTAGGFDWQSHL